MVELGTWYLVGGTLRHVTKRAADMRVAVRDNLADAAMRKEMLDTRPCAFASALVLDEASMVPAPQVRAGDADPHQPTWHQQPGPERPSSSQMRLRVD